MQEDNELQNGTIIINKQTQQEQKSFFSIKILSFNTKYWNVDKSKIKCFPSGIVNVETTSYLNK